VTSKLNYGRKTLSDRLMEVCQCFGVISRRMREIWGTKVPVKVRIFTWQCCFMLNCRQRYRSKKKNWKGDTKCQLCGVKEDTNHIMFRCVNIVVRKKKDV
jgi:hypothetical protein